MQFINTNTGFACGDAGTVLATVNGGTTWTPINITTTYPVRGIYFTSALQGWAVCGDPNSYASSGQLWVTNNGGAMWNSVTWPGTPYALLSLQFFNDTTGYIAGTHYTAGTGADTYYTSNKGTSWAPNPSNIDWNWIYSVSFRNADTGWMIGDNQTKGQIFYTANNGGTWTIQNSTTTFYYGISFPNSKDGFVVGASGTILATINSGTAWNTQTSGTSQQLNGVAFPSSETGWTAGNSGTILMTSNAGSNWNAETSGTTQNLNGIYALDTVTAWTVGDGGTILKREAVSGIGVIENNMEITTYPNPFSVSTKISFNSTDRNSSIHIFDLTGREVTGSMNILKEYNGDKQVITLVRSGLQDGIYFFDIITEGAKTGSGKLVIVE